MSKLPSERMQEIAKDIGLTAGDTIPLAVVIAYLDEQYEQQKPCEHKNTKVFLDENNDFKGKECKDCGNNLS